MLALGVPTGIEVVVLIVILLVVIGAVAGTVFVCRMLGRIVGMVLRTVGFFFRLLLGIPQRRPVPRQTYQPTSYQPNRMMRRRPAIAINATVSRCPRPRCHADNPPGANFCRRCGCEMDARATSIPAFTGDLTFARN